MSSSHSAHSRLVSAFRLQYCLLSLLCFVEYLKSLYSLLTNCLCLNLKSCFVLLNSSKRSARCCLVSDSILNAACLVLLNTLSRSARCWLVSTIFLALFWSTLRLHFDNTSTTLRLALLVVKLSLVVYLLSSYRFL